MMQNTGRYWIYRTGGFVDSLYQSPLTMRTFLLALLLLPFTGCDSDPIATTADVQGTELLTDKRTYYRSSGPYINVSLANVSDRVLYIASPSFDTVLDKRKDDNWVEVGAWYTIGGIGAPTRLEPGTYRTWPALTVREPVFLLEPGQYRIRTKVYEDEQLERLQLDEDLVSEPFEIVPD